ncbi:endonuclease/exonuclease/phosphatase family protein [Streptomyces sp. Ac-502]|uniref:endonuclease/exonuclease/phosphatase family protein n=1 Tax=Streptomyces sp. Ac-502 TaxID=3342801 RepID=UPI0038625EC4
MPTHPPALPTTTGRRRPSARKHSDTLTALSWNKELNGKNNPEVRRAGHEQVRALKPAIVTRQEMWGADRDGRTLFQEDKEGYGLEGELGADACTATFFDPRLFAAVRTWNDVRGPKWAQPPTALTLRYRPAGRQAVPFIVLSFHHYYACADQRLLEAGALTAWADKTLQAPSGAHVTLPALMAGDTNSYPEPGTPGDPPLPKLADIRNRPHRVHRTYLGPDGKRHMDTRPDRKLRAENLMEDVARYWATAPHGSPAAVARTVNACETHGPDARIDRIYATPDLLPAITGVDVIEVPAHLSDHHIVRLKLSSAVLTDILQDHYRRHWDVG